MVNTRHHDWQITASLQLLVSWSRVSPYISCATTEATAVVSVHLLNLRWYFHSKTSKVSVTITNKLFLQKVFFYRQNRKLVNLKFNINPQVGTYKGFYEEHCMPSTLCQLCQSTHISLKMDCWVSIRKAVSYNFTDTIIFSTSTRPISTNFINVLLLKSSETLENVIVTAETGSKKLFN